jgi:tRNA dimethylallyltransferase
MSAQALRALAILGPTGAGKSQYALALADELPIEIISVDSAQVYRGLDIGTAKPTAAERAAVPHHLIDIRAPEAVYSAGEFRRDALDLIAAINGRGRLPVLVGGTMLYYRALFQGIAELPQADAAVRADIDARATRLGWPALHAELARLDPQAGRRIHVNDAQRIQRALEVQALGGESLTTLWQQAAAASPAVAYRVCVLEPTSRAELHARLEGRLQAMLAAGFVEEVRHLLARGTLGPTSPALRLVGYRQLSAYCEGRESLTEAQQKALFATRQLAKRQLTWLRSPQLYPSGNRPLRFDPLAPDSPELFRVAALETWSFAPDPGLGPVRA